MNTSVPNAIIISTKDRVSQMRRLLPAPNAIISPAVSWCPPLLFSRAADSMSRITAKNLTPVRIQALRQRIAAVIHLALKVLVLAGKKILVPVSRKIPVLPGNRLIAHVKQYVFIPANEPEFKSLYS
jgi:hypothetical protein